MAKSNKKVVFAASYSVGLNILRHLPETYFIQA